MESQYTSMLRIGDVCRRTGLSKSQIHRMVLDAAFPRPVKLSRRATGWVDHEVDAWLQARISSARTAV